MKPLPPNKLVKILLDSIQDNSLKDEIYPLHVPELHCLSPLIVRSVSTVSAVTACQDPASAAIVTEAQQSAWSWALRVWERVHF